MKTIFVYGTLKKGFYNHKYFLKDARFIGPAKAVGFQIFSLGSFPGMDRKGGSIVHGEIYEVEDNIFQAISHMECGAGYSSEKIEVGLDNRLKEVNTYIYPYNNHIVIPGGIWK